MSTVLTYEPQLPLVVPEQDEAAAREALRGQIARLERDLATQRAERRPLECGFAERLAATEPRPEPRCAPVPRLLSLGELEAARDALADQLHHERALQDRLGERQEGFRRLREEILLDPAAHAHARVRNSDIGEPGCHDLHVRPRFGLLGRLASWWRVVISSGCP